MAETQLIMQIRDSLKEMAIYMAEIRGSLDNIQKGIAKIAAETETTRKVKWKVPRE